MLDRHPQDPRGQPWSRAAHAGGTPERPMSAREARAAAALARVRAALDDRYEVQHEIGRGGMATIYLAVDRRHERRVAVKVLHPEMAATVGARRFVREIRTEARLTHPHIVPLLDSGDAAGVLYYVMPFVEGESLRARLDRVKRLSVADALRVAAEIADALDCAHRHDVLHRDVKPENILLEEGHAVVVDFGVARAISTANTDGSQDRITATGVTVGTLDYMSPEQANGDPALDGRSDIYGVGCVLHEMLVGVPPYRARSMHARLAQIQASPVPSVRLASPDIPSGVDALVRRSLARLPADRYATAAELRQALEVERGALGAGAGSIHTSSSP